MKRYLNYIGGDFSPSDSDRWLPVFDPSTGEAYAEIPDSTEHDVANAVGAAKQQTDWPRMSGEERSIILNRIANGIDENLEELALAESVDNGKPLSVARTIDIPRSARNFRFFASAAIQFADSSFNSTGSINYTLNRPLGVVGCISPWNLPLYLFTWKIAPALATGNCVVAKPSEITPATAAILGRICTEAGLPAGVLNIVHGRGIPVGQAISTHPDIKAVSFTGSTQTGRAIAAATAATFKKVSLEMGGKNPVLIFDDCNFDKMIDTTVRSSFSNQGEICLCGSRIFIQKTLYPKFKDAFISRVRSLTVGDPLNADTDIGAIVSAEHLEKIRSYAELAIAEGGNALTGGTTRSMTGRCANGWFFEPTVIEGLPNSCRTNQEEIFGPVVTIAPFKDEGEAIQLANESNYGLASVIWTENLTRAHQMADNIRSGIVWINCWMNRDLRTPFGGVNESGVGREGGDYAMRFFTEPKNVCIDITRS